MISQSLEALLAKAADAGAFLMPGASEEDLASCTDDFMSVCGASLPEAPKELLQVVNGLRLADFIFFPTNAGKRIDQDLVSFNTKTHIRWNSSRFAILAQKGQCLMGFDRTSGAWETRDENSGTIIQIFESFEQMLGSALKAAITQAYEEGSESQEGRAEEGESRSA